MKMKSMKENRTEKDADKRAFLQVPADAEPSEGFDVHLNHHHLAALGMNEPMEHGDPVRLEGRGHVSSWHTEEGRDGKPYHRATVTLTHAGAEFDKPEDSRVRTRNGLRDTLEKATDAAEANHADRDAARIDKKAVNGVKVPERKGG